MASRKKKAAAKRGASWSDPATALWAIDQSLAGCLSSPAETDRCGHKANVVDGLFAVARAINRLAIAAEGDLVRRVADRPEYPPASEAGTVVDAEYPSTHGSTTNGGAP